MDGEANRMNRRRSTELEYLTSETIFKICQQSRVLIWILHLRFMAVSLLQLAAFSPLQHALHGYIDPANPPCKFLQTR